MRSEVEDLGSAVIIALTDFWNREILPPIRKNYGPKNVKTIQDVLLQFYMNDGMFDDLDRIDTIKQASIEILRQNGTALITNGLTANIRFN